MLKFWVRTYGNGKLLQDAVCDALQKAGAQRTLEAGLKECCYQLDLPNPMIMSKHVRDMQTYSLTRFLPDEFPEAVDFDRMEVTVFDDSKNKKQN